MIEVIKLLESYMGQRYVTLWTNAVMTRVICVALFARSKTMCLGHQAHLITNNLARSKNREKTQFTIY